MTKFEEWIGSQEISTTTYSDVQLFAVVTPSVGNQIGFLTEKAFLDYNEARTAPLSS